MPRSLALFALLSLSACAAPESRSPATRDLATREPAGPSLPDFVDVGDDDCIASTLVYDRPPAASSAEEPGIAFVNDGCAGDRIFFGFDGTRRELTRAEAAESLLGEGEAYADSVFQARVTRGRLVERPVRATGDAADCPGYDGPLDALTEYAAVYEATVEVTSGQSSWRVDGTLRQMECDP